MSTQCDECQCTNWPDLVIPYWAWTKISDAGDDSGMLCPTCILRRLEKMQVVCEVAVMSGPARSVSPETMMLLRTVENMELALRDGRENGYSGRLNPTPENGE
ncbi:MAG: hypothetical protein AAFQ22_07090 [Pseudomonadota bacterium]